MSFKSKWDPGASEDMDCAFSFLVVAPFLIQFQHLPV